MADSMDLVQQRVQKNWRATWQRLFTVSAGASEFFACHAMQLFQKHVAEHCRVSSHALPKEISELKSALQRRRALRVPVDDRRSARVEPEPGKQQQLVLEKFSWLEIDGVRQRVPQTMAVYESAVLLMRDLAADVIGRHVLRGQMNTIVGFMAETRRIAELVEAALQELAELQAAHV